MKKYTIPVMLLILFETVAIVLWQTKDNLFYLLNFSYIGCALVLGLTLYINENSYARRVTQLLVGMYMLLYQGAESFKLWTGHEMPVDFIKQNLFK